jgi:hypothetical protein
MVSMIKEERKFKEEGKEDRATQDRSDLQLQLYQSIHHPYVLSHVQDKLATFTIRKRSISKLCDDTLTISYTDMHTYHEFSI